MMRVKVTGIAAAGLLAAAMCSVEVPSARAGGPDIANAAAPVELSAQSRTPSRARPQIRITPRQPDFWRYPRPGDYSWPGPNAYRDCVARLEPEWRPSGTVIVPRTRCWWVGG